MILLQTKVTYNYAAMSGPAVLLTCVFLLVRYWSHLPAVARWVRFQYNALPAGLASLLHGYIGVGIAEVWLHVLHWPDWLLIALSVLAVVYWLVRSIRSHKRDLDARIKKMLRDSRRNVAPVLFLAGVLGLAWGYAWLH